MTTFRIISIIVDKKENFKIEILENFLFWKSWKEWASATEIFENGELKINEFTSYSEAEGYLFLKINPHVIERSGNIYKMIFYYQ